MPCCMEVGTNNESWCRVCGDKASGLYFGAIVCLPCKSFYIRCTKDGQPDFACVYLKNCDITKNSRLRCQACRYQKCLKAGMSRKEKPEVVVPNAGQDLCAVCGDIANGVHFGKPTCEGCKKFFRRALKEYRTYVCIKDGSCPVNPRTRNDCRFCRYHSAISAGMSREAIRMGRPKKSSDEYEECAGGKRFCGDNTMRANGSVSQINYSSGSNSVFPEPSVANNALTTVMSPTMLPTITTATTEMAAVFPDTFRPQSPPPDLDELYRLALQEQESMNSVALGSSSSSSSSSHYTSPVSSPSSDTGPTSPEPPATPADLFIPGPYDSILEEMFDRQFWKQQRHRLAWSERMSPVQSQLVSLLCDSYRQLHTTTDEPQHTKAFFYHSSKDFFPDSEQDRKPVFKIVSYRLARITNALVDYVKSLPGLHALCTEDLTQLCRMSFINTLFLLESMERYQPKEHNFQYFWNWKLKVTECTYHYRNELLTHGAKIYHLHLDRVEKAVLMAATLVAPDWVGLKERSKVASLHSIYMEALKSYLVTENKGEERLEAIMSIIVPARELALRQSDVIEKLTFTLSSMDLNILLPKETLDEVLHN